MMKIIFKSKLLNFLYNFLIILLSSNFYCSAGMLVADSNST